jgi:release factor glutamine methyltransferase
MVRTSDLSGTVGDAVRAVNRSLRSAGIVEADIEARRLMEAVTGHTPSTLFLHADDVLSPEQSEALDALVRQRVAGVPVARLLGEREFYGLALRLVPEALDPRPDTEVLVDAALEALPGYSEDQSLRILDLGCGSGAIGLALLSQRPDLKCWAVDRSAAAAACAQTNASRLGFGARYMAHCGDWAAAIGGTFDAVLSNPPYIRRGDLAHLPAIVRDHDPALALDGGPDGLDAYRAILRDAERVLSPGGFVAFETGWDQQQPVARIGMDFGFDVTGRRQDLAGRDRGLVLRPRR